MPDLRPLNDLRTRLAHALALPKVAKTQGWAPAHKPMGAVLAQVVSDFGQEREARPANEAMVAAVRAFWRDKQVHSFNQLKYICYGLTMPVDADGKRLIDRPPLFKRVLELVDARQGQAKPFRRCYQGLLSGYFAFERRDAGADAAQANWLELRSFLGNRLLAVEKAAAGLVEPPLWFTTLLEHANLLQEQPCARYARALRKGDRTEFQKVCSALAIDANSWVWQEAVLTYISALVDDNDRAFKADLRSALEMVQAREKDGRLPEVIAKSAAALLVMRYAHCQDKPEHPLLRDTCIERIGNPWLDRAAWDGAVRDEDARRMVESWLKRGLIKDFFELLSHDGAADQRRLNYWLKWEPQISDMWFALGGDAQQNRSAEFRSIRERMRGRERRLAGATAGDNAFIMRISNTYIIEFGLKGTACFVFDEAAMPLDLDKREVSLPQLRAAGQKLRLIHRGEWELDFDDALRDRIGTVSASTQPRPVARRAEGRPAANPTRRTGSASAEKKPVDPPSASEAGHAPAAAPPRGNWPEYLRPGEDPFGRRSAAPPPRSSSRPDLPIGWEREVRLRATSEGLRIDDRRNRGGAFWLLGSRSDLVSHEFRERLGQLGFRWTVGKGFYLETDP